MKCVDFANRAGFVVKDGFYIKESNGFNLMLMEIQQGYVKPMIVLVCLDREISKDELKLIQDNVGYKKIRFADNKSRSILLFSLDELYGPVKDEKIERMINYLSSFTYSLNELNIKNQYKCIFCGLEKEDEEVVYGNYNGLYLPQHLSCRENAKNRAFQKMNQENANTQLYPVSILLGLVGAVLAALLINILVYMVLDGTVYSLMYAAVPLASFYAYKLGKAPRNKNMIISVVITSVIATLFIDFVFYGLMAVGNNVSFAQFFNEFKGAILGQEAMTLLFLGLGTWVSWNIISKTNDSDVKKF